MRTPHILAAVLAATILLPAFAETKIATIDIEKIVRLHPNTASDKKLLQKTLQDYQAEAEALESAALAARKAFDSAAENMRNPALGEKARKAAEDDAKQKYEAARAAERAFLEKKQGLQRSLTDQEVRMQRLLTDITRCFDIRKVVCCCMQRILACLKSGCTDEKTAHQRHGITSCLPAKSLPTASHQSLLPIRVYLPRLQRSCRSCWSQVPASWL